MRFSSSSRRRSAALLFGLRARARAARRPGFLREPDAAAGLAALRLRACSQPGSRVLFDPGRGCDHTVSAISVSCASRPEPVRVPDPSASAYATSGATVTRRPGWASLSSAPPDPNPERDERPPRSNGLPSWPRPSPTLPPSGEAMCGPVSPRAAGCLGQRVPTASTWAARPAAARGSPSATAPTTNSRLRRCGTPKKRLSTIRQARPYPRSASVPSTTPKSRPPCEENAPGTFSQRSHSGRKASTTRANSKKRPERSPWSPARRPATLRS